jgi:ectoine hydroxylase
VTTDNITEECRAFANGGFVVVRGLLSPEETDLLGSIARKDQQLAESAYGRMDASGQNVTLALRNELSDDIYSAIARSRRITGRMSEFLGDDVYHYHHKLILKEPKVGGAWEWHQDYGYWYYNGCLEPNMLSIMVALDRTDADNGCLKVLRGSHKLGRLDHVQVTAGQNTTDPERMPHILARYETVDCVLDPGDAVIFHGNTLHRSDQNRSDRRRWTFICCYNAVSNDTFKREDDRYYVPLDKVDDGAIMRAGLKFADPTAEHFTSKPYVPKVKEAS